MSLLPLLLPLSRLALAAPAEAPPRGWVAEEAHYTLRVNPNGAPILRVEYHFAPVEPRWEAVRVVGPGLTVTRTEGPVSASAMGLDLVLPPVDRELSFVVEGYLDGRGAAALSVLPATVQTVEVVAPGWSVEVAGEIDGHLTPTDRLSFTWTPGEGRPAPAARGNLVFGETATAAWGDEADLAVRTRVRWRLLRGSAPELRVEVGGLRDLEVTGPNVATWSQQGSQVRIVPRNPDAALFEVDVSGRVSMPPGRPLSVPGATPLGVQRVERWWMLGKAEELDLIPAPGPAPISARMLPPWARGIAETTPTAWWHGSQALTFTPVRYEPLMGPDTVVESAEFVAATAAEGRVLLRATWYVRNERRQYLHVTPPEGWRPMTVRVSGEPVTALSDGGRGLYVPLEKSVETMKGLVSFPVEVTWIAEGAAWEKKGEQTLSLPAVDAPIQAAQWQVYLPRGVERRARRGEEAPEVPPPPVVTDSDRSDALWLSALKAYKENRWDDAQDYLDDARKLDEDNENVARLQSNLDVLNGGQRFATPDAVEPLVEESEDVDKDGDGRLDLGSVDTELNTLFGSGGSSLGGTGDGLGGLGTKAAGSGSMGGRGAGSGGAAPVEPEDPLARRVRDLANAKTAYQMNTEAELTKKAEEAVRAGDYDAAEGYLNEVVDLAKNIGVTQQLENQDQAEVLAEATRTLDEVRRVKSEQDRSRAEAEAAHQAAELERATLLAGEREEAEKRAMEPAQAPAAEAPPESRPPVVAYEDVPVDYAAPSRSTARSGDSGRGSSSAAEIPRDAERQVRYRSATEIDFEGLEVEGQLVQPQGDVVLGRRTVSTSTTTSKPAATPVPVQDKDAGSTAEEEPVEAEPDETAWAPTTVDTEPVSSGQTLNSDFLARIPTGRDYQSSVSMAPGVTGRGRRADASTPPPPPPPPPEADTNQEEELAALGYVDDPAAYEPAPAPNPSRMVVKTSQSAPDRGRGGFTGKKPADAPAAPAAAAPSDFGGGSTNENTWLLDGVNVTDGPAAGDGSLNFDAVAGGEGEESGVVREVRGGLQSSLAGAVAEEPRKALEVSASPFTPALPLDGEAVLQSDALLPADQFPTLTIPYRTRRGG